MTPPARLAAGIDLLSAIDAAPRRPADAIAHDFFRARRFIGGGDRRAVSDLVWGVLRQRLRLDWHLAQAGAVTPTARLRAAAHAVVQEHVAPRIVAARFSGGRFGPAALGGAEAAVLDRLGEAPQLIRPEMPDDVRLNLPDWAIPGLAARFGDALAAEAAALERDAPLDLRANLLRGDRASAQAALAQEGVRTERTELSPWGLRLAGRQPITGTAAYRAGVVEVQDEGSQLVALLTAAKPGMRVLDLCAGAGGKTLALAATMRNRGRLLACDPSAPRLEGAVRRLRRAGVSNAECHLLTQGDRWLRRRHEGFDRVLVDAPCTGSGTWRRNPDARHRTTADDLRELRQRQGEILDIAAELVRPGGWLVYATCSLLPEEDEAQVQGLIDRHPRFAPVPVATAWAAADAPGTPPTADPLALALLLTPARHGTDGFFAAVLARSP